MTNRYDANCNTCRTHVPAGTGTLSKANRFRRAFWKVTCNACLTGGTDSTESTAAAVSRGNETSYGVVTSTGWVGYRNRAGRCEDAPCCGCCTF
jgi:hypothetical protein